MKFDSVSSIPHHPSDQLGLDHGELTVDREEGLRLAVETGNIGLWVWNVRDRSKPKQFSKRLYEILGLPLDTVVTQLRFLSCVHPDDRDRVDKSVQKALSGENGGNYHAEYRIVRQSDGATRCLLANGKAFFDAAGTAYRFIGTVMDVTDQKMLEEFLEQKNDSLEKCIQTRTGDLARANTALGEALSQIKRSESDLRSLVDVIPTQVWFADRDGRVLYHNRQWLDYTGMTVESAQNSGWQDSLHPDDLKSYVARWAEIIASGAPAQAEARFRRYDGRYLWFLMRVVPTFDGSGQIVRWYGTNTDIDERRASEHVVRGHLNAITETLSALTHESDSDRLLEHVMCTITSRMHAHSVAFYEQLDSEGFSLRAIFEGGHLEVSDKAKGLISSATLLPPNHPLWEEMNREGDRCLIGELDPPRIKVAGDPNAEWFPAPDECVPSEALGELIAAGVVALLIVPMKIGGKLSGVLSIRSTRTCLFQSMEVKLGQALGYQAMLAVQLMNLAKQTRVTAVLNERERLARNLHDTLAQGFTGVIVQLEASEDARSQGLGNEADQHVARASQLARESLQEARRSLRALRSQALENGNLCDALRSLLDKMTSGTSTKSSLKVEGIPFDLQEKLEDNLLRICQEVLTNTLRHAAAKAFDVEIFFAPEALEIRLRDNGRGFDNTVPNEGYGLVGIRERVELMGGDLKHQSTPGAGTCVAISVPIPAKPKVDDDDGKFET